MTSTVQLEDAGFWKRFLALTADFLFYGSLMLIPVGLSYIAQISGFQQLAVTTIQFGSALWVILGMFLIEPLFESSQLQATPGKLLLGIKVVDADGQRISFVRALLRRLAKWLSGPLTMNFGYLVVALTNRKQGIHDFIVGTRVINVASRKTFNYTKFSLLLIPAVVIALGIQPGQELLAMRKYISSPEYKSLPDSEKFPRPCPPSHNLIRQDDGDKLLWCYRDNIKRSLDWYFRGPFIYHDFRGLYLRAYWFPVQTTLHMAVGG